MRAQNEKEIHEIKKNQSVSEEERNREKMKERKNIFEFLKNICAMKS